MARDRWADVQADQPEPSTRQQQSASIPQPVETQQIESEPVQNTKSNKQAKKKGDDIELDIISNSLEGFLNDVEKIKEQIDDVQSNTKELKELHRKALNETNSKQVEVLKLQSESLTEKNDQLVQKCRIAIKELSKYPLESKSDKKTQANQEKSLANKLINVAKEYQSVQQTAKDAFKKQMKRQYQIARPDATEDEIEQAIDNNNGAIFAQELASSSLAHQQQALRDVQSRHEEIVALEKSIIELYDVFTEMQALLEQQQEQIDVIEQDVEDADVHVASGNNEMAKAVRHAIAMRKTKWIIFGIVLAIIVVIILVVYFNVK